jgi:hypothetical protein
MREVWHYHGGQAGAKRGVPGLPYGHGCLERVLCSRYFAAHGIEKLDRAVLVAGGELVWVALAPVEGEDVGVVDGGIGGGQARLADVPQLDVAVVGRGKRVAAVTFPLDLEVEIKLTPPYFFFGRRYWRYCAPDSLQPWRQVPPLASFCWPPLSSCPRS